MDTSRLEKEIRQLEANFRKGEAHLRNAISLLLAGEICDAADELNNLFLRIASLPSKAFRLEERFYSVGTLPSLEEDSPKGISLSHPDCDYENPYVFRCIIDTPPFLRDEKNGRYYADIVGEEVASAVTDALPKRDHRFKEIDVIFVNRIVKTSKARQPYYDNDNILIKRILDSIISFVAIDDAARYCSNIYSYTETDSFGFVIYVVERGHFSAWAAAHQEIKFAQEFLENRPIFEGKN